MPKKFEPTPEQGDFIKNAPLESVLMACPGSGKTHTAVLRFIERCKARKDYGVAFLSYTNVAVAEALERAREANASGLVGDPNLIATLDSFFRRFIFDPFVRIVYPDVPVTMDVFESRPGAAIANDDSFNVYGLRPDIQKYGKSTPLPVKVWGIRGYLADDGSIRYEFKKSDFSRAFADAPDKKSTDIRSKKVRQIESGFATYNDVLLFCLELASDTSLRIAEILAARFGEIIIDEAQDTSALQQAILAKISEKGAKLTYIGDKKQGIYQFNRANPRYLDELLVSGHKRHELTENFRSNKDIIGAVNSRFGTEMVSKRDRIHADHGAFVFVGSEHEAIQALNAYIAGCDIDANDVAVIVRERDHLDDLLNDSETKGWRIGPRLALEAWQSERRQDLERALRSAARLIATSSDDKSMEATSESRRRELGWLFLRSEQFPRPTGEETPKAWMGRLKMGLESFLVANGLQKHPKFGNRLAAQGSAEDDKGSALEKFEFQRPDFRTTVIHQVKGETISAVLVVAPSKQHAVWLDAKSPAEEQNVCYVAFTRAADLLILHCPKETIAAKWREHGFVDLPGIT